MMTPTPIPPGFPIWGWVMVSLALGQCAGMITMFYLHRSARKDYCARCTYYLKWRQSMQRAGEPGAASIHRSASDPW